VEVEDAIGHHRDARLEVGCESAGGAHEHDSTDGADPVGTRPEPSVDPAGSGTTHLDRHVRRQMPCEFVALESEGAQESSPVLEIAGGGVRVVRHGGTVAAARGACRGDGGGRIQREAGIRDRTANSRASSGESIAG